MRHCSAAQAAMCADPSPLGGSEPAPRSGPGPAARTGSTPAAGAWPGRPPGLPGAVPPPSVPLAFLAAASLGLVACGAAWAWAWGWAGSDPSADPVVAAVHLGVLATLATGVLGAVHQFTPVITGRPLRSVRLARLVFVTWLGASWLLPLGVATEQVTVTAASGALAGLSLVLLAVNLAGPLAVRGKGTPVTALRLALAGALSTSFLGVAFVGDRQRGWFVLSGHVDLAMGVLGLFGWLGLTYVGVAEKLWPMFLLAHLPGRHRSGRVAVWCLAVGVTLLAPALAWGADTLAWAGGVTTAAGLGAHLVSLAVHVRHRRRAVNLHLVFVLTAAAWVPVGAGLAVAAALVVPRHHHVGVALSAAALSAFGAWLLEALVGHAHKVVPFIVWSALRARGVATGPSGAPLLFADLYDHRWAAASYGTLTCGVAALCTGLAVSAPPLVAIGGALLVATGLVVAANLSAVPVRLLGRAAAPTGAQSPPSQPRVTG